MTEEEPTGDAWRTLDYLASEVRRAADKVDLDRDANERRIQMSVRKLRWYRIAGVIGAVLSVLALWAGWRANYAADRLLEQRTEARVVTCQKENETADRVNALNNRTQTLLRNAVANNTTRTPAQQASTEAFLAAELAEYEKVKVPKRPCDVASVNRYYERK